MGAMRGVGGAAIALPSSAAAYTATLPCRSLSSMDTTLPAVADVSAPTHDAPPRSPREVWMALLVAAAFFMENLDGTIIATAVPAMARDFGVAPVDLNLGVSAYLLTLGVLIPISGWMADRLGARTVFAAAIAVFTAASLLCGMVDSLGAFIATRVLQGVGGAMMVPVGRLVVLRSTPKERMINAIAILTWPALVAPVLGPPLGGFITTFASWRWIFYLNLPLGAAALVAALWLIPNEKAREPRPFDWFGFALTSGGLFGILWSVEVVSRPDMQWREVAMSLVPGVLLLAAGVVHLGRAKNPMLSLAALRVPTFAVTFWGGSLFRMSTGAVPFLLPLLFQVGFGLDAFHSGLLVLAVFAGNLSMKPMTTSVLRRFGFRTVLIGNGLLNAVLLASLALLSPATPVWVIAALLFAGGMTRSMQFTTLNIVAFADIPQSQMSPANTLFSTVFQLAMGIGIALGAVAIRLGQWAAPHLGFGQLPAASFRLAFVVIASVALLGLIDSVRLARNAGDHVARPQLKPAN
ncbi:MAG: transporter protein [Tardiphaga sp.]|jgi:EmrB/QacA subfamily drug resistance transporter|nr:transporter protein [Tardiphaga sp.]